MIGKLLTWVVVVVTLGENIQGPPGDARLQVSGKFTDGTGKIYSVCRVQILYPARKSWSNPDKTWRGGDYRIDFDRLATSFTISPYEKATVIEVDCRGAGSGYRSPVYSLDESRDIDVGHVVLERANTLSLQEALCRRDVRGAKLALSKGQDPNSIFTEGFGKGHTPLTMALTSSDCQSPASFELVSLLVESGADVNKRADTRERTTPLFEAVHASNVQSVEYLLQRGADVNARDAIGQTPLMAFPGGRSERNYQIAEILLKAGADPNVESNTGMTADDWAELMGHGDVAELIRRAKQKK